METICVYNVCLTLKKKQRTNVFGGSDRVLFHTHTHTLKQTQSQSHIDSKLDNDWSNVRYQNGPH